MVLCFWVLALLTTPLAKAETEVVVLGLHLAVESHPDAVRMTDKLVSAVDRQRGLKAISPELARSRVRGRGDQIIDEALTGHGRTLLAEGRLLFEQAELDASLARLLASVEALEAAMAGTTDSRPLIDALLLVGMVQLSMGEADEARRVYKKVLRLDPDRELDAVHYPPKVVKLFKEVRSAVLAAPRAAVIVEPSDPNARVFVDGRFRGHGRVAVEDLVTGEHYLLVSSESGHRSYAEVGVVPGSKKVIKAHLKRRFVGKAAGSSAARSAQVAGLYRSLGDRVTMDIVLIAGQMSRDQVGIQLFEPRTGNFSRMLTAPVEGEPSKALVQLATTVGDLLNESGVLRADQVSATTIPLDIGANPILAEVLLDARTGDRSDAQPARRTSARSSHRPTTPWYVWAGVGALTAGAAGAAFALQGADAAANTGGTTTTTSDTGTVVVVRP